MGNTFKRRRRPGDYREQHSRPRRPHHSQASQLVDERQLADMAGTSAATIDKLARGGILPIAARSDRGFPMFDLNDQQVAEWLKAATATQSEN